MREVHAELTRVEFAEGTWSSLQVVREIPWQLLESCDAEESTLRPPDNAMRLIIASCSFWLLVLLQDASAGEIRQIELIDGSIITGEVVSLSNGRYTVQSADLGTITIEDAKVRSIRPRSASPDVGAASGSSAAGEIRSLQERMLSDQGIVKLIQSLQNDPEFTRILEDPEIMKAVQAGDIAALSANPRFMNLLRNSTVHEIQQKIK